MFSLFFQEMEFDKFVRPLEGALDGWKAERRRAAATYDRLLADLPLVTQPVPAKLVSSVPSVL